jgi:hypothetical protein
MKQKIANQNPNKEASLLLFNILQSLTYNEEEEGKKKNRELVEEISSLCSLGLNKHYSETQMPSSLLFPSRFPSP